MARDTESQQQPQPQPQPKPEPKPEPKPDEPAAVQNDAAQAELDRRAQP